MGRVKTTATRALADRILRDHGKRFTEDFEQNKQTLGDVKKIKSKKVRNVVAGYITTEVKRVKKTGI